MCDAGYFSVFDEEEVHIYDARTTKITASNPPVLKGWRDKVSTLWRIPLIKQAPAPDVGQVTNWAPGTRSTSWDVKKNLLTFPPHPHRTNRQRLPTENKTGGDSLPACRGRIPNRGNMVQCGQKW